MTLYLDLVFIDGDHSYDAVREDRRVWLPTVRARQIWYCDKPGP